MKETPEMIREICEKGEMGIPVAEGYQAVGILYKEGLVITAAAHDGNGEANMASLRWTIFIVIVILFMLAVGYYLANATIRPIEHALSSQKMFCQQRLARTSHTPCCHHSRTRPRPFPRTHAPSIPAIHHAKP